MAIARIILTITIVFSNIIYYYFVYAKNQNVKCQRSNCLVASFHIWQRFGGKFVMLKKPTLKRPIPHFGIKIQPTIVLHFTNADNVVEPVVWFKGRVRRDYCGER